MNVSAIIVTRGNVDLAPCWETMPAEWEKIVWDNGSGEVRRDGRQVTAWPHVRNLSVYGRYAAIKYASHDLVLTQDDDVIVSDPEAIADEWHRQVPILGERIMESMQIREYMGDDSLTGEYENHLVANQPEVFRHDGYTDSCLVGFGAAFHRDAPRRAFERFEYQSGIIWPSTGVIEPGHLSCSDDPGFQRTCDVVFTALTPRVLVDVPKTDREFASDPDRMWKQPEHYGERVRMLELARRVRDAQ